MKKQREEHYHVLIIISSIGFTKKLVDYITGSSIIWVSVTSKYVTTYLVDSIKGKVYYDTINPVAKNNVFLANINLPKE
ncbi:MAG: hypothetical protein QXS31_05890 [Desulfurococcaceae archaeon]